MDSNKFGIFILVGLLISVAGIAWGITETILHLPTQEQTAKAIGKFEADIEKGKKESK